ncbi:MAG: DUF2974 domain-containing protein [Termitinemataceae bacterium]|nr:MAG: DUF2974 domain-containing protein [Termitinemataceae bacterium]
MNNKIFNLFDYIYWRGDIPFAKQRFNPLDNIVFSMLSYLQFDNIVKPDFDKKNHVTLEEAIQEMEKRFYNDPYYFDYPVGLTEYQHDFVYALSGAARYKNTRLSAYINLYDKEREAQFSAITFFPEGSPAYIAFRGTDSTLIGWKEDFNMALENVIPAQMEAKKYLQNAACFIHKNFYTGGHSKGGNLAVYAASECGHKIQKRIITVYNNDGPGFAAGFLQKEGYRMIQDRIEAYLPESSLFGLLFEHDYKLNIVKSNAGGIAQHAPYTWLVKPDNFVYAECLNPKAVNFNKTIMSWIYGMEIPEREHFIETLYSAVTQANINSVPEFIENWLKNTAQIFSSIIKLDADSKKNLVQSIVGFITALKKHSVSVTETGSAN